MSKMKKKKLIFWLNKINGSTQFYSKAFFHIFHHRMHRTVVLCRAAKHWVKSLTNWAHSVYGESFSSSVCVTKAYSKWWNCCEWVKIRGFSLIVWMIFCGTMLSQCQYWNERPNGWSHFGIKEESFAGQFESLECIRFVTFILVIG